MALSQAFARRLPYSEKLITQVENGLRISIGLGKGQVKLGRRPTSQGESFFCELQETGHQSLKKYIQADNRATEWTVALAVKKGASSASTWVGCRLKFEIGGTDDYLVSCSVLVLALREEFYPLIRAEWDYRGIEDGCHAQPHWHMLTALQAKTREQSGRSDPEHFDPALVSGSGEHVESLHLAMSTNWALTNGSQHTCELLEDKNLVNWIRKVSEYSINQVQYALNKSGTFSAISGVKDFAATL